MELFWKTGITFYQDDEVHSLSVWNQKFLTIKSGECPLEFTYSNANYSFIHESQVRPFTLSELKDFVKDFTRDELEIALANAIQSNVPDLVTDTIWGIIFQ